MQIFKIMKKRNVKIFIILIISIVILTPILLDSLMEYGIDISYKKELKFGNCEVEYEQYLMGKTKIYEGHYIYNNTKLKSAKKKIAICLCKEYEISKNNDIADKIIEIAIENCNIVPVTINIDNLIKNRDKIFDPTIIIQ